MKQNLKKILALLLALAMCLEPVGNVVAEKKTGREQDDVMSNAGSMEMSGNDSVGHLLAETLSEEQGRQEALAESGDYITELEVSGNQASVDFCTTTNAEVIVAIYEEKTGRMIGSGKTVVGIQDFSADMSIDTGSNTMPQYFIATAYLLDVETHYPLCEELTVDLYTENMQKLLSSTVNDYPDNPVVNLDENLSTNFAVGNKDMLALNEDTEPYQIMDNGDGTYTVKYADDKIKGLHVGDTLSYEYADGSILLIKVSDIAFDGNTVIITEEKDVDLTDFFDYIKIEADSYGCEMRLEEVPGSDIDMQVESDNLNAYNQSKIRAWGPWEDGDSFSQSFSVPISKKWKGVLLKGSANLGFTATIKYYLSLNYQYVSTKIEYSLGGSVDISGKLEMLEIPLMRVELPVLPCVNVGFTPSFVVQASGKIALSVELKGTLGVEYDSNNGMKNLCKAPSTSSKLEITGTIFIGIKATPYVGIINADLAKVKLDMTAGIEAKAKKRLFSSSSDDKHECKLCFDGTLSTKLSATAGMDLIKNLVKLEAKIAEINLENGNFYYSTDYGEFGWSTCPHIKYKTTINTIDVKGNTVSGAKLVIKNKYTNANVPIETPDGKNENAVTDDSGKIDVYLGNGTYIIEAATDDMSGTKNFTVHDRKTAGKITLIEHFNSDITTDPDKCSVEVKAVDESGKPVAGAVVSCAKLDKTYKTDMKGIVTLKLTSGTYDLLFKTDTLTGYVQINVENENVNETVIMKSVAHGVIHLTVVDESGNPISDVQILGTGLSDTPQTDKNGKVIFELEVGKQYHLSAKKSGLFGSHSFTMQEGEHNIQIDMKMETFWWELKDGVLTIHGNGDMPDYSSDNLPEWCGGEVKKIIIMDGITSVGVYAFYNCSNLTSVEIPDGVLKIEGAAFRNCSSLESIELPPSLTSIQNLTFAGCSCLTSIEIPDGVNSIGDWAFEDCSSLESIELPSGLNSIGMWAFRNCISLSSIELPSGLNSIKLCSFENCKKLSNIKLPSGITSLESSTFSGCSSLESIKIPNNVSTIGKDCFSGCTKLANIELPLDLATINDNAFSKCSSLKNINLPSGLINIGGSAFVDCCSLESIEFPSSLRSIGEYAFASCDALTKVEIPSGVNVIKNRTFEDCCNLVNVVLPSGLTSIESRAFNNCKALISIDLPKELTMIGREAFKDCSNLISIGQPLNLITIDDRAFVSCSSLESMGNLPNLASIGKSAFFRCYNLTDIILSSELISVGTEAFGECSNLKNIGQPSNLPSIGEGVFRDCSSLEDIEVFSGVVSIEYAAFQNCDSLKKINFPSGLISIGKWAFKDCNNLIDVKFPSGLSSIGVAAFQNCNNLENIALPSQMTSIEEYTFSECSSLSKVELPSHLISIGRAAFSKCSNLSEIEFPDGLISIGHMSFDSCTSLTRIEFPVSLDSLDYAAFSGCGNLSKIYFKGDKPSKFATNAFSVGIKTAYYPQNNSTWIGIDNYLDWDGGYVNKVTWVAYDPTSLSSEISAKKVDIKGRNIVIKSNNDIIEESQMFYASSINSQKSAFDYTGLMPEALYIFAIVKDEKANNIFDAKNLQYIEQGIASNTGQIQFSFNDESVNGISVIYGPSNKNLANAEVTVGKITADGTVQYPDVLVVYNGVELEENIDYKLSGDIRITDAGTYSLMVKGINDYAGSKTVSYTTSNADIKPDINISIKIAGPADLKNGSTVQLVAEISPADADIRSLSWSSDNPSVAVVDQQGLVTAKGEGKAKITVTCTSKDGKTVDASCVINVEKSSADSDNIGSDANNSDDTTNNGSGDGSSGNGSNNGNSGSSSGGNSSSENSGFGSSGSTLPSGDNALDDNPSDKNNDQLIAKLAYYIVQFDANLGIKLSRKTMTLLNDDNLGILPKVQRKNYIFNGWYTQKIGGTKVNSSTVLNAGTTLFAHWTKAKPSKVKVLSLKSQKSGQIAVNFQKIAGAKGYEISYSTKKKFSSSTTKKTISVSISDKLKKLKSGKKYYVRVRAYNLDSTGKKVYGSYSAVKSIKVK